MSLSAMIRKRQSGNFATATPAIFATHEGEKVRTVATVATVAVANVDAVKTNSGKPCSRWLFHFTDRDDLPVTFAPAVDHAAALAYYPDAIAAEPIPERPQRKATKAKAEEVTALVKAIYANDTDDDRAEALAAALADPDGALRCYRTIAKERGLALSDADDDRRTCDQCANLIARRCQAAKRGEIAASRNYEPIRDLPRRCEGYAPGPEDTDRRPGRERWPGLIQKGGE